MLVTAWEGLERENKPSREMPAGRPETHLRGGVLWAWSLASGAERSGKWSRAAGKLRPGCYFRRLAES